MSWGGHPDEVGRIRTIYVDDHARNVALGRRIARGRYTGIVYRSLASDQNSAKLLFCGCSSMVEQKLPKLTTRVRFPSPAPGSPPKSRLQPSLRRGQCPFLGG
jgi:hypothetical protein